MGSNFMQGVQIITAFATLVMAFAAGATALFSRRVAEENRLLRRATTEPEVIAYLLPDTTDVKIVNFYVHNVGSGVAMDILFSVEASDEAFRKKRMNGKLLSPSAPLTALPPGGFYKTFFGMGYEIFAEPVLTPFSVSITYKDAEGVGHSKKHIIDVTQFNAVVANKADSNATVVKAINSLEKQIALVSKASGATTSPERKHHP